MKTLFKLLGIGVAAYTCYAAATGSVWAKSGIGSKLIRRDESPVAFWSTIACYGALSLALLLYF